MKAPREITSQHLIECFEGHPTGAERDAYRALLACLRRGSHRRNLASLISLERRRSSENVLQWMEQPGVRLTVDPAEVAE